MYLCFVFVPIQGHKGMLDFLLPHIGQKAEKTPRRSIISLLKYGMTHLQI